jgi:hypothetical protein
LANGWNVPLRERMRAVTSGYESMKRFRHSPVRNNVDALLAGIHDGQPQRSRCPAALLVPGGLTVAATGVWRQRPPSGFLEIQQLTGFMEHRCSRFVQA